MLKPLSPVKVSWAKTQCRTPVNFSGSPEFDAYAAYVMNNQGYFPPNTWQEALKLYFDLSRLAV